MLTPHPNPGSDQEQARRCYREGLALLDTGDEPAAGNAFLRATTLDGSLAAAHYQLGTCLRRRGQEMAAEQALLTAIALDASIGDAYISLAYLYRTQGKRDAVATTLMALTATRPADVLLQVQVAGLLADMDCHAQAASIYEDCLRHQAHTGQTHLKLGQSYQKLGRFEDAERAFLAAIDADANSDAAYLLLAHTRRFKAQDRLLVQRFEAILDKPQLSAEARKCLHFSLGKLYDDLGSYDRAFEHFRIANTLQHQETQFNRQALADYVESVKKVFTPELFKHRQTTNKANTVPVFVVGMLRSGTTLTERILARHPQMFGLGETELVDKLAERLAARTGLSYPACVVRLNAVLTETLAAEFQAQWPVEARTAAWVIDKNPLNFLHLGLIALVFPGARILHCVRNPMDTCLSIYFQYFAHLRNTYAYDLDDIVFFYKQYAALMSHWRAVLPVPIHEVRYEELVKEQERVSRALISTTGLRWHPDCLKPHQHPTSISTASLWQARQPIYRDSVDRWRHYSQYLEPLKNALGKS